MTDRNALLEEVLTQEFHMVRATIGGQSDSAADAHLTMSQFRALLHAADATCTMADMAGAMGVKPNVATGIVQRLVDKNFLERTEDPQDRRARLLALTAEGHDFLHGMMNEAREQRRVQLTRLSDQQLRNFLDILVTLVGDTDVTDHACAGSAYADAHFTHS
jgi:DNA-binding MarR family transcriptional regulator